MIKVIVQEVLLGSDIYYYSARSTKGVLVSYNCCYYVY